MARTRRRREGQTKVYAMDPQPRDFSKGHRQEKKRGARGKGRGKGKKIRWESRVDVEVGVFEEREEVLCRDWHGREVGQGDVYPWDVKVVEGTTALCVGGEVVCVVVGPKDLGDLPFGASEGVDELEELASTWMRCKGRVNRVGATHVFQGYYTQLGTRVEFKGVRGRESGGFGDYVWKKGAEQRDIDTCYSASIKGLQAAERIGKLAVPEPLWARYQALGEDDEGVGETKGHFPHGSYFLFTWRFRNRYHYDQNDDTNTFSICVWRGERVGGGCGAFFCLPSLGVRVPVGDGSPWAVVWRSKGVTHGTSAAVGARIGAWGAWKKKKPRSRGK
jgi:hypothetical protein